MIHEIKSSDWTAFCEQLSQQRAKAMVNLEVIESNGVKTERATGAAFQSMVFNKTDACSDVITLRLMGTREIVHEILDPIRITLHPSGRPGDFNPIQIVAENGTTIITLHPAIHAQILADMQTSRGTPARRRRFT